MSLAARTETFGICYEGGVTVFVAIRNAAALKTERAGLSIDKSAGERLSAREPDDHYRRALYLPADLIGFVNGLPLVVIELKKPGVPARQGVR